MRRLVPLSLLLIAGCAGQQLPPDQVPWAAIKALYAEIHDPAGPPPIPAFTLGAVLDDRQCYAWFDKQLHGSQESALVGSVLGMGTAAAAGVMAPPAAPLGLGLASGLNGALQANSPTGASTLADYGLTVAQREAFLAAAARAPPATPEAALAYLDAYHRPCTLSGILLAGAQAKMTAPVVVMPPATDPPVISPPVFPPPAPLPPPPVTPTSPPIVTPPPDDGGPVVTPNLRKRASGAHPARRSFFEQNPPTFALVPSVAGLMAVPPRICVGYGGCR